MVYQIMKDVAKTVQTQGISTMSGIHLLGKGYLKLAGYEWAVRRRGDVKLGYWRKTLRAKKSKSSYPKRFVLIPGFGDTPLSWYLVISLLYPVLKMRFDEIILFDFPGYGGFLSHEKAFPSLDLMNGVMGDTLDSLKPHTILGHSLGGWLTANYAGQCGEGTRPLANKRNYAGPQTVIFASPSGIFNDAKVRKKTEYLFKDAIAQGGAILRPHLFAKEPVWFRFFRSTVLKFFEREDIHQFIHSISDEHSADRSVENIRSDIWLIWGEEDSLIPPSCAAGWIEKIHPEHKKGGQIILLKNVGHSLQWESPAITAAVIGQILLGRVPHPIGKLWWTVSEAQA